jgi:hypothetical protein
VRDHERGGPGRGRPRHLLDRALGLRRRASRHVGRRRGRADSGGRLDPDPVLRLALRATWSSARPPFAARHRAATCSSSATESRTAPRYRRARGSSPRSGRSR